jgi:hypothetical protein
MRRDGFSVSSNGKLGQPADVAALMKEAQACLLSIYQIFVTLFGPGIASHHIATSK